MLPALGSKEVCRYAILPFRPGKEDLTILPQQDADSSLLRGWEAKQEILEFLPYWDRDQKLRAEHDGMVKAQWSICSFNRHCQSGLMLGTGKPLETEGGDRKLAEAKSVTSEQEAIPRRRNSSLAAFILLSPWGTEGREERTFPNKVLSLIPGFRIHRHFQHEKEHFQCRMSCPSGHATVKNYNLTLLFKKKKKIGDPPFKDIHRPREATWESCVALHTNPSPSPVSSNLFPKRNVTRWPCKCHFAISMASPKTGGH